MKPWLVILGLLGLLTSPADAQETPAPAKVRFAVWDVVVDAKDKALAAYQLEIKATRGKVKIAGIEGGESPEFRVPPVYDPRAIQQERVIIAAFSTAPAAQLPKGKIRVASLHLQIEGDALPQWVVNVQAAGTVNGGKIPLTATLVERKAQ